MSRKPGAIHYAFREAILTNLYYIVILIRIFAKLALYTAKKLDHFSSFFIRLAILKPTARTTTIWSPYDCSTIRIQKTN
ncbi:hypothetical protein GT93_13370 [Pseudomonas plecoglossicida]|nr:hypothetical protein GT93_13370 [Pseudomonas plecoglossicida]